MQTIYDSHVHSIHSPDSTQPVRGILESALEKGIQGFALTDHVDLWFQDRSRFIPELSAGLAEVDAANAALGGRLEVLRGVELAEYRCDPALAEEVLALTQYDVVLSSVHCLASERWPKAYAHMDFSTMPEAEIQVLMSDYFAQVLEMAEHNDFDVLTHLTCPLRYINGKYHRQLSTKPWSDLIDQILTELIRRDKALEVNSSGIHSFYGDWMPGPEILSRYYAMGGRKITLASDAHTADRVANGFAETITMLRQIGFSGYVYYRQREAQWVLWDN